jgi:hypothetical protein
MLRCQGVGRRSSVRTESTDLRDGAGISGGVAVLVTEEKAHVADDAVTDRAESREPDEQPLLEERRHRRVEVSARANPHSSSISSGAASADRKKFGTMPKRLATSRRKRS